jgi:predicted PurR-regulated permease PerM
LTCFCITTIIIVPFTVLILQLAEQATQVYQSLRRGVEEGAFDILLNFRELPLVGTVLELINSYVPLEAIDLQGFLVSTSEQVSVFFIRYSTVIVSQAAQVVASFGIMLIAVFFLLRDGSKLVNQLKSWTPLSEHYEQLIGSKFQEVASATILGSLLTALAQGVAGGLVFWILGIPNVLLWGSLMALFSLVPLVGTAIVWVPWVVFLFASGSFAKAIILTIAAIFFVGMIDNIVRPLLIEGKVKMHTLLIFLSIMGGIAYFGMVGMIFGPILVALGLTFLELYKLEFRRELIKTVSTDEPLPPVDS